MNNNKKYQIIYHASLLIEVIRIKGKKLIYRGYDILSAHKAIIEDLGGQIESINGRM